MNPPPLPRIPNPKPPLPMSPTTATSVILDIETLSRRQNAVITDIGLIAFDRTSLEVTDQRIIFPGFFPQIEAGRHLCNETVQFHRLHGTLPKQVGDQAIQHAHAQLSEFILKHQPACIWIHGKDFDIPKLETLFTAIGQPLPWKYHQVHCARDAWHLAFGNAKRQPRPHAALGDCEATHRDLILSLQALGRITHI